MSEPGLVRSNGADHVIDYTQEDCTRNGQQFDLILRLAESTSPSTPGHGWRERRPWPGRSPTSAGNRTEAASDLRDGSTCGRTQLAASGAVANRTLKARHQTTALLNWPMSVPAGTS